MCGFKDWDLTVGHTLAFEAVGTAAISFVLLTSAVPLIFFERNVL